MPSPSSRSRSITAASAGSSLSSAPTQPSRTPSADKIGAHGGLRLRPDPPGRPVIAAMHFGIGRRKRRLADAAQPMHRRDATRPSKRASDISIAASASSRPKKCSGTRIGTFECAILPGNGGRFSAGPTGDCTPPGNGPRGGFLAGSRKALSRARASSSVMPCRSPDLSAFPTAADHFRGLVVPATARSRAATKATRRPQFDLSARFRRQPASPSHPPPCRGPRRNPA